jgi:hypothetical protein
MSEMESIALSGAMAVAAAAAAAQLGKPIVQKGCDLIDAALGRPFKVAGGILADEISFWRWKNRLKIAARSRDILDSKKVQVEVLPPSFLLPLLDAAGNVDDPDLAEMWAQLLAGGSQDDCHRHPAFIETLRWMSGEDARFLKRLAGERIPVSAGKLDARDLASAHRLMALSLLDWDWEVTGVLVAMEGDEMGPTDFGKQFIRAVMPDVLAKDISGR